MLPTIKNVTIVVRLEGGAVKKAMYDGEGHVMQGDISVLEDVGWAPKGVGRPAPPPPPKQPSINAPFDMPISELPPPLPAEKLDLSDVDDELPEDL